jgi:uncharacterized membrane protein
MWFIYALLSAVFSSVRRTSEKELSQKISPFTIGWVVQLTALPFLAVALLLGGELLNPLSLGIKFWLLTAVLVFGYYPANQYFYVTALKHGELSRIMPLQSLGPVFAMLLGWIGLHQRPTAISLFGIAATVCGVYALNLKGRRLHNPLTMFTADKPNLYVLCSVFLSALVGLLDVYVIRLSSPMYYSFVSTLLAVPVFYLAARTSSANEMLKIRRDIMPLSLAGGMFAATYVTYLLALNAGPLAYVNSVRSTGLLLSSAIGILYFKETLTKAKLLSYAFIILGTVMLGVFQT